MTFHNVYFFLVRFFVYLFDNGIDGALCHLLHIYLVGRNRHIRQVGRIQEIVETYYGNILRYPLSVSDLITRLAIKSQLHTKAVGICLGKS